MDKEEIVPDVIDTVPQKEMSIHFANGAAVKLGNVLTPTQGTVCLLDRIASSLLTNCVIVLVARHCELCAVKDPPTQISWPTEPGALYTLIKTDPDAPSRNAPKFREWHHWLGKCDSNRSELRR